VFVVAFAGLVATQQLVRRIPALPAHPERQMPVEQTCSPVP